MLIIMINILGAIQKNGALLLPWGSENKLQNCKRLQVKYLVDNEDKTK